MQMDFRRLYIIYRISEIIRDSLPENQNVAYMRKDVSVPFNCEKMPCGPTFWASCMILGVLTQDTHSGNGVTSGISILEFKKLLRRGRRLKNELIFYVYFTHETRDTLKVI